MGASRSRVGTSMEVKHATSIGSNIVTLAVISVTSTMPVSGARTTPVKKAANSDDGKSLCLNVQARECQPAEKSEEQAELRAEREHGCEEPARCSGGI